MITQKEKEQIFALYWGQLVIAAKDGKVTEGTYIWNPYYHNMNNVCLLLKPLSAISDEDAMKVAKMDREIENEQFGALETREQITVEEVRINVTEFVQLFQFPIVDYLRSRGYAVPYMNHSVDELVNEGIFKLVEP